MKNLRLVFCLAALSAVGAAAQDAPPEPGRLFDGQAPEKKDEPKPALNLKTALKNQFSANEKIIKGVEYLLERQNNDGSWDARGWKQGSSMDRSGNLALASLGRQALQKALDQAGPLGLENKKEALRTAIRKADGFVIKNAADMPILRNGMADRYYAFGYNLSHLAGLMKDPERADKDRIKKTIQDQLHQLENLQRPDGGWAYRLPIGNVRGAGTYLDAGDDADPSGIAPITAVIALGIKDATGTGDEDLSNISQRILAKSIKGLKDAQASRERISYRMGKGEGANNNPHSGDFSATRDILTDYAVVLLAPSKAGEKRLNQSLSAFEKEWSENKRDSNNNPFNADYYYPVGLHYVSLGLERQNKGTTSDFQGKIKDTLITDQREDGSWNYTHSISPSYNTIVALNILLGGK